MNLKAIPLRKAKSVVPTSSYRTQLQMFSLRVKLKIITLAHLQITGPDGPTSRLWGFSRHGTNNTQHFPRFGLFQREQHPAPWTLHVLRRVVQVGKLGSLHVCVIPMIQPK
jgi:hypothetical protein